MKRHSVEIVQLSNGAEGLFIHIPNAPVISYELNFRAGEYLVPKEKWEVPHLMEHVILGANQEYPDARAFQAEWQKNGAYSNAYTGYYSVSYVGEVADFEWERVLKLQLIALSKPLFTQREFKAEWGNIRDELTSYCNNHFRHLGGELNKAFGQNIATDFERIELMQNVKRSDLVSHYLGTHYAGNLRFVIAGNLIRRKSKLLALLDTSPLAKGGKRIALPIEKAKRPKTAVFVPNETVKNIYLYISSYANKLVDVEEETALHLVRILLTDTLHSRIFGTARERGLVYSVNSGHHRASEMTEWSLLAQVLPSNAPALCDIIIEEVSKVKEGLIDDRELDGVKQYALGTFQRSLQTVGSIANAYSRYFFDETIEDINDIPRRIQSTTKAQMAGAMNQLFNEKIGSLGILGGNDRGLCDQLSKRLAPLWN